MAPKTDYATQFKELKDLIETTNNNIKLLENRITTNYEELMARVCNVETQAKEALDLAKKNEIIINEVLDKQQETNDDLSKRVTTQVKEDLHINKIETQLRGVLLELEDLRNRSMRSNLIFKGIPEESKETWDDTSQLLAGFITENLNLPYSFDQMDMQISRAHRTNDTESSRRKNKSEPRPIIAQFINWRVAEEVRQKIIHLNSRNQLRVIVNQMFSKELTERRNNALIKRKEYLILHPDLQIKLDYPAALKSHQKGQNNKWLILEEF